MPLKFIKTSGQTRQFFDLNFRLITFYYVTCDFSSMCLWWCTVLSYLKQFILSQSSTNLGRLD